MNNTQEQIAKILWDFKNNAKRNESAFNWVNQILSSLASPDEALREAIAKILYERNTTLFKEWEDCGDTVKGKYIEQARVILSLIQPILSARVELAKQEVLEEIKDMCDDEYPPEAIQEYVEKKLKPNT